MLMAFVVFNWVSFANFPFSGGKKTPCNLLFEVLIFWWVWRTVSFYFEIKEFHHLGRDLTDDLSSGFHHLNVTETAPKVTNGL